MPGNLGVSDAPKLAVLGFVHDLTPGAGWLIMGETFCVVAARLVWEHKGFGQGLPEAAKR